MAEKSWRKTTGYHGGEAIVRCAAIILPYLNHAELASISSTCKTLNQFSKAVTSRRTLDSTRGIETLPIPFFNPNSGDSQPYSYFIYSPTQIIHRGCEFRQPWGSDEDALLSRFRIEPFLFQVADAFGCNCVGCSGDCCPCSEKIRDVASRECGPSCECDLGCGNRVTQRGITRRLKIVKNSRKGWGLYAAETIPGGQFICEYAGELLSTEEARRRLQSYDKLASFGRITPALLVVKEHLSNGKTSLRINIDATMIGNVARFINHSCDGGNLNTAIVRSSGALLPRVCIFASRDIHEDEELTFSYGDVRLNPNGRPCFCGTSSCAGVLPSEHT